MRTEAAAKAGSLVSPSALRDRRRIVETELHALGRPRRPRRAPPPEGRLGTDERPIAGLRAALEALGPVFADFGQYLSSRVDLFPRRDCMELAGTDGRARDRSPADPAALVIEQLGDAPERRFFAIDPSPRRLTRWEQRHDGWLASGEPVEVTIVRPDAGLLLTTDLPLLPLLAPWLDAPKDAVSAAIEDFSATLQRRLDQTQQASAFIRLAEDAQAGGTLDAPRCYREYCAPGILTLERIEEAAIADALDADQAEDTIDRERVAHDLAWAWLRQAVTGRVVPFDFDLHDFRLRDGRLVLVGGALEPMTSVEGPQFLRYLVAAAADEPDRALAWISATTRPDPGKPPHDELRRRLRQAVPFRDGEWSGDDRLAEQLLVHWRAVREAGATMLPHPLHLYRGIHAVSAATTRLACEHDALLAALQAERLRQGVLETRGLFESRASIGLDRLLPDLVDLPRRLDEILTQAADGRLRVKVHMPEAEERHEARNRTVSLVASLVALVGVTFIVRQVAPAYGSDVEALGAVLVLIVGGWLLVAASRL